MKIVEVFLPTPEKVQEFVSVLAPLEGNFDLVEGNYVLDAKSLMGIFNFDLSKPIHLTVYNDTEINMAAIRPFILQK